MTKVGSLRWSWTHEWKWQASGCTWRAKTYVHVAQVTAVHDISPDEARAVSLHEGASSRYVRRHFTLVREVCGDELIEDTFEALATSL